MTVNGKSFAMLLEVQLNDSVLDEKSHALSFLFSLKRLGNEPKLNIGDQNSPPTMVDEALIKTISGTQRWMKQLQKGTAMTIVEIAKAEAPGASEMSRV